MRWIAGLLGGALALFSAPALASTYTYTYGYVGGTLTSQSYSCTGGAEGQCAAGLFFSDRVILPSVTVQSDTQFPSGRWDACCGNGFITLTDGAVTDWVLSVHYQFPRVSLVMNSSAGGDSVFVSAFGGGYLASYYATGPAGTWSGGPVLEAPIPGALPLFASGLSVLGLLVWRRRLKSAAAAASDQ